MPLDQDLVKRNFLGKDGFIWWIGQIPEQPTYTPNQTGRREPPGEVNGPGERYKVRIFGYHEIECGQPELPDADLPWAQVMYPVTAGGGGGAASQSANLTQGTMVYGFFLDGHDAQQPIIMGCLGYNQTAYSPVERYITDTCNKGQPFDGYGEGEKVPMEHVKVNPEPVIDPVTGESADITGDVNSPPMPTAAIIVTAPVEATSDVASKLEKEDGEDPIAIKQPTRCNKDDGQQGMKTEITRAMREIQRLQSLANGWVSAVNGEIAGVQARINKIIDNLTSKIAGFVKSIINKVRGFTITTVENAAKDLYTAVFPNKDNTLNAAQNQVMDQLSCLFDTIIDGLLDLIGGLIGELTSQAVNVTECLVSGMVGNLLGDVLGGAVSGIQGILDSVSSIIGSVASAASGVVGAILGFIENILQFGAAFSCQKDYSCAETEQWSLNIGIDDFSDFGSDMADTAQSIIDSISSGASAAGGAITGFLNGLSQNGGDCNVGPVPSGPPVIKIIGGGGEGAAGNVIIGDGGEILGVEITNPGSGYVSPPTISIGDPTGAGNGATLIPIIGPPTGPGGIGGPGPTGVPDGGTGGATSGGSGTGTVTGGTGTGGGGTGTGGGGTGTGGGGTGTGGTGTGTGGTGTGGGGTGTTGGGGTGTVTGGTGTITGGTGTGGGGTGGTGTGGGGTGTGTGGGGTTLPANVTGGAGIGGGALATDTFDPGGDDEDDTNLGSGGAVINDASTPNTGDLDDNGDGSITEINGDVQIKVTPSKPEPGDTLTLEFTTGGNLMIDNNFGAKNSEQSGVINIPNFRSPKTFILTTDENSGGNSKTTTLRIVPKGQEINEPGVVKDILVINPGYGYLKESDGSWGANGRQWASRSDTWIIDPDGNYLQPIPPGKVVTVLAGSKLTVPAPVTGYSVESDEGKDVDDGVSQENIFSPGGPQDVNTTVTITTPKAPPLPDGEELTDIGFGDGGNTEGSPNTSDGKYGVRLFLKDVIIRNNGVNFGPDDEIFLEPDRGAKLTMELGTFGSIVKVNVVEKGFGYREFPKVRINTRTGFNQELIPLFDIQRIGDADLEDLALRALDRDNRGIISVVDCVNQGNKRADPSGSSADSGYYEKGKPNSAVKALD